MNIVLVNHYAGGKQFGMEFRPYYLAREWKKQGHNVLIVAASFAHLRSKQPQVNGTVSRETIDGIEYLWLKTNTYEGNGIQRIINMMIFVYRLFFNLKDELKSMNFNPDLFIASSTYPFDCVPLKKIADYFNAKLCFEVHDLWPLSPIEFGGYSKNHPFIMAVQWAEDYAYKNADFVVSLLPLAKSYMVSRGMKPQKFVYIPNGIVTDEWNNDESIPEEHLTLMNELKKKYKFLVGYTGSHGIANSLGSLVEAAKFLKDDVAIVFVGDGPEKINLIEKVKTDSLKHIYFLPPVAKKSIPPLLAKFDALYVAFQKQSLLRFGISPNKMFDYMMAEKPIIQAIEAGNNMVKEYSCGVDVEPENARSIAEGVERLDKMSVESRRELGINGKKAVLNFHDFRRLSTQFLDAYKTIN
jgi:glycosyltransferase involved in cell wall biosynthesis